jgi:hypothetical protein
MVRPKPTVLTIAAVIAAATTATGVGTVQYVARGQHHGATAVQVAPAPVVHQEDGEGS